MVWFRQEANQSTQGVHLPLVFKAGQLKSKFPERICRASAIKLYWAMTGHTVPFWKDYDERISRVVM